ncbi:MAG: RNA 2'-phosphotransferase [Atopobiaceae bacterium]|nr:RNA 2'-phosphotransferase [Atopobiaceae bacterium]
MDARLARISKEVSYALRHAPEEYGLVLDGEGFVPVGELLFAINACHPGRAPVTQDDLEEIIAASDKRRHEISDGRIRALYGHSVEKAIERTPATPPGILYHGTTHKALGAIMEEGLLPMGRQLVHLSADVEMAKQVGGRRDAHPVILQVDAASAHADGIAFFLGNERVWLADSVPARYLSILKLD